MPDGGLRRGRYPPRPYTAPAPHLVLGAGPPARSLQPKPFASAMPGTVRCFEAPGLPDGLTRMTPAAGAVAGTMLLLGQRSGVAALLALPFPLGATWAHAGDGRPFAATNGCPGDPPFWCTAVGVQALLVDVALALRPWQAAP